MPPINLLIICPNGKINDLLNILGVDISAGPNLHILADATPRSPSHKVQNGKFTNLSLAARAIVDSHIGSAFGYASLENVAMYKWAANTPSPYAAAQANYLFDGVSQPLTTSPDM